MRVFPVATGTAANALSLAAICALLGPRLLQRRARTSTPPRPMPPGSSAAGSSSRPVAGEHGKVDADALAQALAGFPPGQLHRGQPAAVSLTQASDLGAVYRLDEVRAIAEVAKGARARDAHGRRALRQRGGAAAMQPGRAVVARGGRHPVVRRDQERRRACRRDRGVHTRSSPTALAVQLRRAGQVWSKMRFASAQLMAYIENGLWLRLADGIEPRGGAGSPPGSKASPG